jgi:hypothetical protein
MEKHMIWCATLKLTNQTELTIEQMLALSGIYLYMIDKKAGEHDYVALCWVDGRWNSLLSEDK